MEQKPQKQGPTKKEIEDGKGMSVLAYIIALIPYFAEKKNKFVRFHAVQGMNLLLLAVGWSVVAGILTSILSGIFMSGCYSMLFGNGGICIPALYNVLTFVIWVPSIAIGVVSIIGIINALNGKMEKVPLLGSIKIIKK